MTKKAWVVPQVTSCVENSFILPRFCLTPFRFFIIRISTNSGDCGRHGNIIASKKIFLYRNYIYHRDFEVFC